MIIYHGTNILWELQNFPQSEAKIQQLKLARALSPPTTTSSLFAKSLNDMPWSREGDALKTKYPFVCHAELNAILNNNGNILHGSRIYTTLFPCNECAKAIIQSGIKSVIYKLDKYFSTDSVIAAKRMFDLSGVKYIKYKSSNKMISLTL